MKVGTKTILPLIYFTFLLLLGGKIHAFNTLVGLFVSPNGNDQNPGTIELPFKSMQKAIDKVNPANVVYIREGVYKERMIVRRSGKPNAWITIQAFPGEKPVMDGTSNHEISVIDPDNRFIHLDGVHYIKVQGISLKNGGISGICARKSSTNITIENCSTYNLMSRGISFGSDKIASKNIKVLNNYVDNCDQTKQEAISLRTVDNFEVAGNRVVNVKRESIDAKSGCKNGTIHDNLIENSGACGIYIDAGYHNDPVNDGQYNIKVYGNYIINPDKIGIAVASEQGNIGRDIHVFNNLIYYDLKNSPSDLHGKGFGIGVSHMENNGPLKNIYIYHNTNQIENIVIRDNNISQ